MCLLHEKPFAGVNGSGKHDNWSLATDTGENLLKPGSTPSQNAQFLLFLAAFIKGVDEYQEMLRCCVSYPGNDHRLGGNEAPPPSSPSFLGDELTAILDAIIQGTEYVDITKKKLTIGVDTCRRSPGHHRPQPHLSLAFTGNKFEFRMLGSSQSIASPNVVLNTIMAEELGQFADILERPTISSPPCKSCSTTPSPPTSASSSTATAMMTPGCRRPSAGVLPICGTPWTACPPTSTGRSIDLFTRHAILTETEMRARYEIHLENYCKVTAIEASTLLDMAQRGIIPAVSRYTDQLAVTLYHKTADGALRLSGKMEQTTLRRLSDLNDELFDVCEALQRRCGPPLPPMAASMPPAGIAPRSRPRTRQAGELISRLETLMPADVWPFPTYADILFSV